MAKTENYKKTSDFKLRLLGLALCSLMLGGVVVAGCGGDAEEEAPATTTEEPAEE